MADHTPLSIYESIGKAKGGVVVLQEAFGVNDHIEDVGQRVAADGWFTVVPHLFHRTGDPRLGYDDIPQVMPHMNQLAAGDILDDIDAALTCLVEAGISSDRIGVVGFCMGGTMALVAAARRDIGAAVTFYGGGVARGSFGFDALTDEATRVHCPWLGLYGDLDESIPVAEVEQLRTAAASSGQDTDVVRYPDAGHGFHCDQRSAYHAASAHDAWQRTLGWFNRYLCP